jgi:glutamyl-tRNA(Gln) amidotransferase subunit E
MKENLTKFIRKTRYLPVQNAVEQGMIVNCVLLKGFKGLLRWQTQTDTYFSKEISDRIRVVACLTTLPNIIHSDSTAETISTAEWQNIKKFIGGTEEDTLVLVWGDEQDGNTGAQEIVIRAIEATIGIPSETRQALRDGTNGFERILPGPNRMYPDTDLPPKRILDERLEKIKATLPKRIWENEQWYRELQIPDDVIEPLAVSSYSKLFEMLVSEWKIDPTFASVVMIQFPKRIKKLVKNGKAIDSQTLKKIFEEYKNNTIARDGIFLTMKEAAMNGELNFSPKCTEKELAEVIEISEQSITNMKLYNKDKSRAVLMGLIMPKLRGRVDGSVVAQRIGFRGKESK